MYSGFATALTNFHILQHPLRRSDSEFLAQLEVQQLQERQKKKKDRQEQQKRYRLNRMSHLSEAFHREQMSQKDISEDDGVSSHSIPQNKDGSQGTKNPSNQEEVDKNPSESRRSTCKSNVEEECIDSGCSTSSNDGHMSDDILSPVHQC